MANGTFKLDYVRGKWQVRLLGPDMRPCMSLNNRSGKPRRFKSVAAATAAANKFQAQVIAFATRGWS
jgi:hypothetical protein